MTVAESILQTVVGPTLIANVRSSQIERGLFASGESSDSLRFEVVRSGSRVTFQLYGAQHWQQQQNGRRANVKKGRPSTAFVTIIKNWITVKGLSIPLAAAGAIAYKIVNEGTKVPNRFNKGGVLSEPLNRKKVIDLMVPSLTAQYVDQVKSTLFR